MRACRDNLGGNLIVEERKTQNMILEVLPTNMVPDRMGGPGRKMVTYEFKDYVPLIKRLVGHAKNSGVGLLLPDRPQTYMGFIEHYDIEIDEDSNVDAGNLIRYTQDVLKRSVQTRHMIDFDDMLYLPLLNGWSIPKKDFVFVDEAQDTNAVQRSLVTRMVKPKGRTVWVGDPHQAIYGFRGASNEAMDIIKREFKTTQLPLTVSFRCPRAVVKHAQQYVSHITAHESAPEGAVTRIPDGTPLKRDLLTASTAIVCRTTAPLVTLAFHLIGKRIGCQILGRDIGTRLTELVKRMKATTLEELSASLEQYRIREIERARAKEDEAKEQSICDQIDSIEAIITSMEPTARVDSLLREIDAMFSNTQNLAKVTLCTVHKSKGLEWHRVIIIRPDLMPLPWVRVAWQQQQEKNLAYVAATRAKEHLIIVAGENITIEEK
jgi:DNA helicase-2/ATP-dependent DNA helicase PcrA